MTLTRTYITLIRTLSICVLCLLVGCSGHRPWIPRIERPLTTSEAAQVLAMADMIDEGGAKWADHSEQVRKLLALGRIGVGRLPQGKDGWATWKPRITTIILRPGFFEMYNIDQSGVLVIEACRTLCACVGDCSEEYWEWQRDWFLMNGDQ